MMQNRKPTLSRFDWGLAPMGPEEGADVLREMAAILDTARKPLVPDVVAACGLLTSAIVDAMERGAR